MLKKNTVNMVKQPVEFYTLTVVEPNVHDVDNLCKLEPLYT